MEILKDEIILKIIDNCLATGYTFEQILSNAGIGIDKFGIYFKEDCGLVPEHCRKEDTPKDARTYSKNYIVKEDIEIELMLI